MFAHMKLDQVATQFYTIRDFCQTSAGFAESCKKVRGIGYRAIQLSGLGPISDDEIVRVCAGEGLTICATHEPGNVILSSPKQVVERLQKLGCRYTSYPYPGGVNLSGIDTLREFVAKLDHAGSVLREAGLALTYHNHAMEFHKVNGRTILDWIYDESRAENLQAEIDTYWVQAGGADPVAWCRKLKGRLPLLHLKDCTGMLDNRTAFCEIGNGNLDFVRIIDAAEQSGCEWFIVEQDTCPGDPFDSLKISFDYIATNLVRG